MSRVGKLALMCDATYRLAWSEFFVNHWSEKLRFCLWLVVAYGSERNADKLK
jgi:hypothetical protein